MRTLTLLLCLLASQLNAQDLLPLGATWRYEAFGGWNPGLYGPREMVVEGTITIDTIPCKIVRLNSSGGNPQTRFVYADNDRIYVYRPATQDFLMLYDFGAQTGDTVHLSPGKWYRIDSIGVLSFGPQELRFQHIRFNPGTLLNDSPYLALEGIGLAGNIAQDDPQVCSYFFLNESFCDAPLDGQNIYFRCYEYDGFRYDPHGACTTGSSVLNDEAHCRLYPNPVRDMLYVEPGSAGLPEVFQLYDLQGRIVLQTRPTAAGISLHAMPAGLYRAVLVFVDGRVQVEWITTGRV